LPKAPLRKKSDELLPLPTRLTFFDDRLSPDCNVGDSGNGGAWFDESGNDILEMEFTQHFRPKAKTLSRTNGIHLPGLAALTKTKAALPLHPPAERVQAEAPIEGFNDKRLKFGIEAVGVGSGICWASTPLQPVTLRSQAVCGSPFLDLCYSSSSVPGLDSASDEEQEELGPSCGTAEDEVRRELPVVAGSAVFALRGLRAARHEDVMQPTQGIDYVPAPRTATFPLPAMRDQVWRLAATRLEHEAHILADLNSEPLHMPRPPPGHIPDRRRVVALARQLPQRQRFCGGDSHSSSCNSLDSVGWTRPESELLENDL
jgi:hypothetical protein